MGSFVERDGRDLFNTSVLLDREGKVAARYRKIHLFGHGTEERTRLRPGREAVVVRTPWGKAGLSICYDLRFPELYRQMVDRGAASSWWHPPGPRLAGTPGCFSIVPASHEKTRLTCFPVTRPAPKPGSNTAATAFSSIRWVR